MAKGGRRGNGEGSIFQRSDGRWQAYLTLKTGRRKNFYGKSRKEVHDRLSKAINDLSKGVLPSDDRVTVEQFLGGWLKSISTSVRPKTLETYDLNVRRLTPHLGRYRLGSLTPQRIEETYATLGQSLSKRSVEQAHAVLHRALEQAVRWNVLGRNPSEYANVPRPEEKEMMTLSADEVQVLFDSSRNDRNHALWVLLATTGLRLGEALGLKWSDVDFAKSSLIVRRALQKQRDVGLVFVEPKTAKSRRTVQLSQITLAALKGHRSLMAEERLKFGSAWNGDDLVFCRTNGERIDGSHVSHWLHAALKKADLPRIKVHGLRHTAASLHLAEGTHAKVVQEMLGHSTIMLTLDTYSHVLPSLHVEAASVMDRLFRSA